MKPRSIAALTLAALTLCGCPDPAKTDEVKTDAKTGPGAALPKPVFGGESPAEVFKALQAAMDSEGTDLEAVAKSFRWVSRASRVRQLGQMYQAARAATITTKGDEDPKKLEVLEGICVRHNVALEASKIKGRLSNRERLRIAFGMAGDNTKLMTDLLAFALEHGKKEPRETRARFLGTLKELKIDGKTGTAKANISVLGKAQVRPLNFVQEDGRWLWVTPG